MSLNGAFLDWNPQGKRRDARPKKTCKRTAESKAKNAELHDLNQVWEREKGLP